MYYYSNPYMTQIVFTAVEAWSCCTAGSISLAPRVCSVLKGRRWRSMSPTPLFLLLILAAIDGAASLPPAGGGGPAALPHTPVRGAHVRRPEEHGPPPP